MDEEKKPEEQPAEPEQPEQAPPAPETVPPPQPVQPPAAMEAAPETVPSPAPPPPPRPSDTNTLIMLGWIFIGVSVLCCCSCYIFAPVAAVLGAIAYSRGDQRGLPILIIGIVLFLIGGGAAGFSRIYNWPRQPWNGFPQIPGPWRRA